MVKNKATARLCRTFLVWSLSLSLSLSLFLVWSLSLSLIR